MGTIIQSNNSLNIGIIGMGALSTPKVVLQSIPLGVQIETFDRQNNTNGSPIELMKPPLIKAIDLTPEHIAAGVYIEMVVYTKGNRGKKATSTHDAYKIPSAFGPNITNPFSGSNTRIGSHFTGSTVLSTFGLLQVDRFNHFKVTSQNETIDVWQYLHNRFSFEEIFYYDNAAALQSMLLYTPLNKATHQKKEPGTYYGYSSMYGQLYFAFRYVMQTSDKKNFITGGLTPTIVMGNTAAPFINIPGSAISLNQQCVDLNAKFKTNEFKCDFAQ